MEILTNPVRVMDKYFGQKNPLPISLFENVYAIKYIDLEFDGNIFEK